MSRPLLQANRLSKSYGFREIFNNISFVLREGGRVALVGPNGVGKSTLIKILAGKENATSGTVTFFDNTSTVGYVPQDIDFDPTVTPWDVLTDERFRLGSPSLSEAAEALSKFGFTDADSELLISNLSGGEKTKLALARVWLFRPDILLLDEPTNYLDHAALDRLEDIVRGYPGTILLVSHDRYFLDRTVERIIELSPHGVVEYRGNYTAYREMKEKDFASHLARYEKEQKEIRRIQVAIDRQKRWAEKAHRDAGTHDFYRRKAKEAAQRAKGVVSRLEAFKKTSISKPKQEKAITFDGFQGEGGGRVIVTADGLTKAFDKLLFKESDFSVQRGDKVGIVGANGSGKTTLLKLILGQELPSEGAIWVSPGVRIGYVDQQLEHFDPKVSVLEEVLSSFESQSPELVTKVRTMLGCFLFTPDDIDKSMEVLSPGEKKRVALIKLLMSNLNVLLLDEPTEHLDLLSREKLEEALASYRGTVILVSHDRYLLKKVCTRVLSIENQTIRTYLGGFKEYHESYKAKDRRQAVDKAKWDQEASPKLCTEERLLLETRLARLNSQLSMMTKGDPDYQDIEKEFFEIAGRLRRNHEP
ncbi:MAG TPA: ABC-F family ATP-binding cassette domain-containing protein [Firmicutes bacterium]|jgi:macrolide transport system ATP-binding/permease protein|nr:ABC-F family ATP-binding cassette domain-containing protein [Bacillota bacterium]